MRLSNGLCEWCGVNKLSQHERTVPIGLRPPDYPLEYVCSPCVQGYMAQFDADQRQTGALKEKEEYGVILVLFKYWKDDQTAADAIESSTQKCVTLSVAKQLYEYTKRHMEGYH